MDLICLEIFSSQGKAQASSHQNKLKINQVSEVMTIPSFNLEKGKSLWRTYLNCCNFSHNKKIGWMAGNILINSLILEAYSKQATLFYSTMQEFQDKTIDPVLDFPLGFMNKSTASEYR